MSISRSKSLSISRSKATSAAVPQVPTLPLLQLAAITLAAIIHQAPAVLRPILTLLTR